MALLLWSHMSGEKAQEGYWWTFWRMLFDGHSHDLCITGPKAGPWNSKASCRARVRRLEVQRPAGELSHWIGTGHRRCELI